MYYVLNKDEMRNGDEYTISLGTSSLELMERAGSKIAYEIASRFDDKKRVLIVVGKGGNGGDGYVAARYLFERNYDVTVLDINNSRISDCEVNKNKFKGRIISDFNYKEFYDIIIDAIFGIGVTKDISDKYLSLIDYINSMTSSFVVSIDMNSGINATNGIAMGAAVFSDLTIAIQEYKIGHFLNQGKDFYNELIKIDIGIVFENNYGFAKILEKQDYKNIFEKRKSNSNKGDYGRVLIIGGSKSFAGAPLLSLTSLSPLLLGAGYSTLAVPNSLYNLYSLKNLETTYKTLTDIDGNVIFDESEISSLLKYDVIAIGMGLGITIEVYKIIKYLLNNYHGRLLIDADGLNSIAKYGVEVLINHKPDVILTPHIKEFYRLVKLNKNEIISDLIEKAKEFSTKYNLFISLKSNTSIITDGEQVYLNINGNPSLAKGGSGDVLSGILAGLLCKKYADILELVACSSYILGRCSEFATIDLNEFSVLSTDLNKYISRVIKEIIE